VHHACVGRLESLVAEKGPLTPSQRTLRGRISAYALHAGHDPRVTTAPARAAFLARFEREVDAVDPEGKLDPIERARRVVYLRRLYFARLAYLSHVARREGAAARKRARAPQPMASSATPQETGDVR
jgi:hypothetical protein